MYVRSHAYVSLKITLADLDKDIEQEVALYQSRLRPRSQYLVALCDFFKIKGPNGEHGCFVFDPMGPDLTSLLKRYPEFQIGEPWERRFSKQFAKEALLDIVRALDFLHSHGVVHGDVHLGNILSNIRHLDVNITSKKMLQQPVGDGRSLRRLDGKADLWAPSYLLEPSPLYAHFSFDIDPLVVVTDLGAGKSLPIDDMFHRTSC